MTTTPRLSAPYLAAAQSQAHVTVNESLRALDVLVQAAVEDATHTAPPASPENGQVHIIASPATGDWAGKENQIAAFQDGAWAYHTPGEGWRVYDKSANSLLLFDAAAWTVFSAGGGLDLTALQDGTLTHIGINTASDSTNRLSVKTDAGFFSHDDVSGAGTGDVRIDFNKLAPANTAAFLLKTNWTAHAEIGLAGDNKLRAKVSPDGANWFTAFEVNEASGEVSFPNTSFEAPTSHPHILDYGIVGDGVADDTAALKNALAAGVYNLDAHGLTCAVNTDVEDPTGGIRLARDIKGPLVVNGKRRYFDAERGSSLSANATHGLNLNNNPSDCGVQRADQNNYYVYMPKAEGLYERVHFSRAANDLPFDPVERVFIETRNEQYIGAEESTTYVGSWGGGPGSTYIGGRQRTAFVAPATATIDFTGEGDVFVIFTGRAQGNFVNVTLNGSTDYVVLPDDGAGNKYFDSYTATDLSHYQIVKVASGVPYGAHQLELEVSSESNPDSVAGTRYLHNCVYMRGPGVEPWNATPIKPLDWQSGEAVLRYEERYSNGETYYATADGTTGATAPSHASGTVSDGGVDWAVQTLPRRVSRPSLTYLQKAGTQLPMAEWVRGAGASDFDDYGGALHGNETADSVGWYSATQKLILTDGEWRNAPQLTLRQSLTTTDPEIGSGATPIFETEWQYTFKPDGFHVSFKQDVLLDCSVANGYVFMLPVIAYDDTNETAVTTIVKTPSAGVVKLEDYYGQQVIRDFETRDLLAIAEGEALEGAYDFQLGLQITSESVDNYRREGSKFFIAPNTSGADPNADPTARVFAKVYPLRNSAEFETNFVSGEKRHGAAFYSSTIHRK